MWIELFIRLGFLFKFCPFTVCNWIYPVLGLFFKAPGYGDIRLTMESLPEAVPLEKTFPVKVKVTNCWSVAWLEFLTLIQLSERCKNKKSHIYRNKKIYLSTSVATAIRTFCRVPHVLDNKTCTKTRVFYNVQFNMGAHVVAVVVEKSKITFFLRSSAIFQIVSVTFVKHHKDSMSI